MAKGPARTFGQDLMRGEHVVGAGQPAPQNGGVLMPSHTSGDPSFYAKKRAKEAELGRELTTEEFLADHYAASDAPTASGTSIFDPVLCEIAYRWFCPPGGTVLDPFAGGSVRGIVAARLGRPYVGIELRAEQVVANQAQADLAGDPAPRWIAGDSRDLARLAAGIEADLVFSCPPYWNLERYSDDASDLSTMPLADFLKAQGEIIAQALARLRPNRFAVWVIGDVRDADGFFVNLPGLTVEAFEAAGARFYNDAILVTAVGSLPIRVGRQFTAARKLGRTHQNVLVFCKGDWGRNLRSWLVDHVVLEGDTARAEIWAHLNEVLGMTWEHASGARMALARVAIDSGDGATTDAVYAWVRQAGHGQVIAIKGVAGFDRSTPVDGPTYVETTEGGRKLRRGVRLWKVAGAVFKAETYRFLRLAAPTDEERAAGADWPAGFVHIPKGTTAEWVKQLTSEQLVIRKTRTGYQKLEWEQTRERNEALDCRVYARAAAWLMGIDRWDNARWEALEEQIGPARPATTPAGQPDRPQPQSAPKRPTGWLGPRRGKWL